MLLAVFDMFLYLVLEWLNVFLPVIESEMQIYQIWRGQLSRYTGTPVPGTPGVEFGSAWSSSSFCPTPTFNEGSSLVVLV